MTATALISSQCRSCRRPGRRAPRSQPRAIFDGFDTFLSGGRVDVAVWLHSLGMERYEPVFRENAIDADVLRDLTADDLKELGIASVGHRRKLLDALTELRARPGLRHSAASPGEAKGERRQVAVLFADLCGFTRMSREVDAEEVLAVLDRYFEQVDRTIEQHGGHVDKHVGDCVMAVFGAPVSSVYMATSCMTSAT
ncbi:adenylate/guanylate cyclase domain-containing protein [Paraburkholderia sp. UCT31]|uniref:adenylate/guanylate cyclase domain-containing protein n=1 Tax=Paraburkholderia sp. UCT31 TaxID=2615209 RepID=UPI00223C2498|nr:adenylate/guanylate cyclase domain-containing protein [Paraburkholderia sp. UCT31]